MSLDKVDKLPIIGMPGIQRFPFVESNNQIIAKLRELEKEFTLKELDLIDEFISITLIMNCKEEQGVNVLKKLQEASGIAPEYFYYVEPDLKAIEKNTKHFSEEALKLSLLEAILMTKDMPPFMFEKLRLKYPLIKEALKRDICQHGCEVWKKLISKVCYTLDVNLKDLTDDQIVKIIKYVNENNLNSTTMMYLDMEKIPPSKFIEHFLELKDLKQLRIMLNMFPKGRNYTIEELEKAQRFIAAGASCAPPL